MAPPIFDIASDLLDCACTALATTDAGCPDRACVLAGGLAWDSCGDDACGQLSVGFASQYASSNFPTPAATTAGQFKTGMCGHPLIVFNLMVTILRCVPSGGPDAEPPSCESLQAAAETAVTDALTVKYAIECCLVGMRDTRDANGRKVVNYWSTGTQNYVGPEGGCGGSQLPVTIGLINNCDCPD